MVSGLIVVFTLVSGPSPWCCAPAMAQKAAVTQKKEVTPGVYMETLKSGDTIDTAIGRGRKLFNDLGCAGCHPRGGTIGGTAQMVDGNRMPIPIPDLRGAALHYPRIAGPGFVATVGMLNDM
jgi:hypothetical protein